MATLGWPMKTPEDSWRKISNKLCHLIIRIGLYNEMPLNFCEVTVSAPGDILLLERCLWPAVGCSFLARPNKEVDGTGNCADLAELPDTKLREIKNTQNFRRKDSDVSTASGSTGLSSASSSSGMSERAARAALQLRMLMAPETKAVVEKDTKEPAGAVPCVPEEPRNPLVDALIEEFRGKVSLGKEATQKNVKGEASGAPDYATCLHFSCLGEVSHE